MLYLGFIERKQVDQKQATLNRLLKEREQINQDIKETQQALNEAEQNLERIVNPMIHLEKDRADQDYAILYRNEYDN